MPPGWLLEPAGNGGPRGMIIHDRTRLIGGSDGRFLLAAVLVLVAACGPPAPARTAPPPAANQGKAALAPVRPLSAAHADDFRATFDQATAKTRILAAFSTT